VATDESRHDEFRATTGNVAAPDDETIGRPDSAAAGSLTTEAIANFGSRAESVLDSMGDGVVCTDRNDRVIYLNAAAEALTGWSRASAAGQSLVRVLRVIDRDTRRLVCSPSPSLLEPGERAPLVHGLLLRGNGGETAIEYTIGPIRGADGRYDGAVIVLRDVGAAIEMSRRMSHLAQHDAVTGLPNRFLMRDRLAGAIALADRRRSWLAVGFLDLDGFKAVNDTLGHQAADELLRSVATRLRGALRQLDTVCRYGGDEFVIVLPEIAHAFDVAGVAVKILLAMAPAHRVADTEIVLTASLGVALYPEHGRTVDALIANADAAMYAAKRGGPGRWNLFETG
jgi:diguanylate cyclase (GGDEF)-like protein/PAS domain S-box-containing protein